MLTHTSINNPLQCVGLRRRCSLVARAVRNQKRLKYAGVGQRLAREPLVITLQPDGSDAWRLSAVVSLLKEGGVGIVPTCTLPAVVCDLENRNAVLKLYNVMELDPKKQLSILCRGFADISHYTLGFPQATQPGQADIFSIVRRIMPGPYTFILPASKALPSQMVDVSRGKTRHRTSVGVRWSADPVAKELLDEMGGALLATSVHVPEHLDAETELVPDSGALLDMYGNRGLDFIVDVGPRVATASSVVDFTGAEPVVVRHGLGDVSMFE